MYPTMQCQILINIGRFFHRRSVWERSQVAFWGPLSHRFWSQHWFVTQPLNAASKLKNWYFLLSISYQPRKHSFWWRRTEDVLKMSWRHKYKTSCKHVLKTSWRRLGRRKVLCWRQLQDVLKTSWKTRNVCWENS